MVFLFSLLLIALSAMGGYAASRYLAERHREDLEKRLRKAEGELRTQQTSQEQVITNSKPQQRAQDKVEARPQDKVKQVGGDEVNSPLNDSIGSGKPAAAGQARANAREAGNPGKTPGQYPTPPNTPGMPASK